ncbi:MAG TPA: sulfotransferase family protein [Sphingomonas sp.]|uniref:sulfotransferase family protein n=1 Tax=Sphingomonas sp. TaxID=28214 RepID=UPI002BE8008D|nr:sulfotransferase family protein [Sphingomonas sp.]HMI20279.1 sulfotransferase family protein [Sphingomonas sp.]
MSRAAILVLGMHRSGTSALTWLLGRLGAALPSDAIQASGDNARGYWESQALVKADDQLLRVVRSSWFDPRPLDFSRLSEDGLRSRKSRIREAIESAWGDAPLLAIKDPRQCRCVSVVADVLTEMRIEPRALLMLRSPAEIARSLASRDGTTPDYAHLLWLRHMIDAERATRGMRRAVVDYDGMLDDWRDVVARIAPLAGRDGWQPDAAGAAEIAAFLDPTLRHHQSATADLEEPLAGIVREVDAGLRTLIAQDDAAARARLDQAYATLDGQPWLEGDIVHDELRHRRMEPEARAPEPEVKSEVALAPAPDPSGDAALIRNSGLFDAEYYLARYPDVAASGLDPVDHYLRIGAAKGYDPSPLFDTGYYARQMARRIGGAGGH